MKKNYTLCEYVTMKKSQVSYIHHVRQCNNYFLMKRDIYLWETDVFLCPRTQELDKGQDGTFDGGCCAPTLGILYETEDTAGRKLS